MTETLQRPVRTTRPDLDPVRSLPAQGASAALWAWLSGLLAVGLPVLLVWAVDDRSGATLVEAARAAGRFWLLAHGAALDVPGGSVSLTPLGLLALPFALLVRFASAAAREAEPARARGLAAWTALPYAGLTLLVALSCSGPEVHVSPVSSVAGALLMGGVAGAVGTWRDGSWRRYGGTGAGRRVLTGATAGLALLLGAGALLAGAGLLLHLDTAVELAGASDPGPLGGLALCAAGLALVPNAAVWGASWLAGPGFAVGTGTTVAPFDHALGDVPALPLLAALPDGPAPTWLGVVALAVPLLVGVVAGAVVQRARTEAATAARTAYEGLLVGAPVGLAMGALAWLSAGAVGGERLAEVGPAALPVALCVTGLVGLGGAAGALLAARRRT